MTIPHLTGSAANRPLHIGETRPFPIGNVITILLTRTAGDVYDIAVKRVDGREIPHWTRTFDGSVGDRPGAMTALEATWIFMQGIARDFGYTLNPADLPTEQPAALNLAA
jgi:hypothetical protein